MRLDFVTDNNPAWLHGASLHALLPAEVGEAAPYTTESLLGLHKVAFADPLRRLYPVHEKAATYLGLLYFYGADATRDTLVENNLLKAAMAHGITQDEVHTIKTSFTKQAAAAPADKYALTVDFEGRQDMGLTNFYCLNTPFHIVKSARQMETDFRAGNLPLAGFRAAAIELMKEAYSQQVPEREIVPVVRSHGILRMPNFEMAMSEAENRKSAGVPAEHIALYRDIVKSASADQENIDKYVDLWISLDESFNVKYARNTTPYQAFYSGATEEAVKTAADAYALVGTVMVPAPILAKTPKEILLKMGKYQGDVEKAVKVAATSGLAATRALRNLPAKTAKLLAQELAEHVPA